MPEKAENLRDELNQKFKKCNYKWDNMTEEEQAEYNKIAEKEYKNVLSDERVKVPNGKSVWLSKCMNSDNGNANKDPKG